MNKYFGFYELKSINLPTVPWERFTRETSLDEGLLWTIRVAVEKSNDLNLPRRIGARADEALSAGNEFLDKYSERGLVIYYPYFIAEKSGVLEINSNYVLMEAVERDLWNLVTHGKRDVTVIIPSGKDIREAQYHGRHDFLKWEEIEELLKYAAVIKGRFRDSLSEGKSIFAEWSFAYNTDANKQPIGNRYLVFYELRAVK